MTRLACLLFVLFALACQPDRPERFPARDYQGPALGFTVTFPAKSTGARHSESTPFGQIDWFSRSCMPAGRMDQVFLAEVGTLPAGGGGGQSQEEVLETLEKWIKSRYPGDRDQKVVPGGFQQLAPGRGLGFEYLTKSQTRYKHGIIMLAQGKLYHANATGSTANSPEIKNFLNSFNIEQ